jgi:NAD-dependent SIR2 family protein deacetylase
MLITAGAGMGVDSGLPDFRGSAGFWEAYPPYKRLGLRFEQLANPMHFNRDPHLAWGFYGHRLHLYQRTIPHQGFVIARKWAEQKPGGYFVFTSNVDGQFQAAGFASDSIVECHGSIHHLQCSQPCDGAVWPVGEVRLTVDEATMRASDPLPTCPTCGSIARPNILMFGDMQWNSTQSDAADRAFDRWRSSLVSKKLCVIECGAGTSIPTVRLESERICKRAGGRLIRINVREPNAPAGQISIASPAAEALRMIDKCLQEGSQPTVH